MQKQRYNISDVSTINFRIPFPIFIFDIVRFMWHAENCPFNWKQYFPHRFFYNLKCNNFWRRKIFKFHQNWRNWLFWAKLIGRNAASDIRRRKPILKTTKYLLQRFLQQLPMLNRVKTMKQMHISTFFKNEI